MSSRPYVMKGQRNNRKKGSGYRKTQHGSDQKDKRWKNQAKLQQELKWEEQEIRPIKDVLTKLQQSSQTNLAPLKSLEGGCFKLWSTDHVKYCTVEAAPTKYIEFYDPKFHDPKFHDPKFQIFNMCRRGQVSGHIYAVSDDMCDIDPFSPPENAGLKTVRIDGNDERYTFDAEFLDDDHLIIQIPKDLVFYRQEMKPPSEAPDVFTYYGICEVYYESLILANHRREEQAERRRSASPA